MYARSTKVPCFVVYYRSTALCRKACVKFLFLLLLFPMPCLLPPLPALFVRMCDWTDGNKITLSGFGVFQTRSRAGRTGRNPRTGEPLEIKPSTLPAFTPAKSFKEQVSDVFGWSSYGLESLFNEVRACDVNVNDTTQQPYAPLLHFALSGKDTDQLRIVNTDYKY